LLAFFVNVEFLTAKALLLSDNEVSQNNNKINWCRDILQTCYK